MSLPTGSFLTRKVQVSGGEVEVRGLSYAEGLQVRGDDGVYVMIALSTGYSVEDVKAWCGAVTAGDVHAVTAAITDLSGFGEGAQFQE